MRCRPTRRRLDKLEDGNYLKMLLDAMNKDKFETEFDYNVKLEAEA